MFPGTEISIGDEKFVVPALSLGQLRAGMLDKLTEHDKLIADGKTFEAMVSQGEVILQAIRRNYPDFPEEKLMNWLDLTNVSPLWMQVLGASGFNVGETQAATTKVDGT